jgi:DivIVA domain-containing protein
VRPHVVAAPADDAPRLAHRGQRRRAARKPPKDFQFGRVERQREARLEEDAPRELRGFDRTQVSAFLAEVADDYDAVGREIDRLQHGLAHLRGQFESVRSTKRLSVTLSSRPTG